MSRKLQRMFDLGWFFGFAEISIYWITQWRTLDLRILLIFSTRNGRDWGTTSQRWVIRWENRFKSCPINPQTNSSSNLKWIRQVTTSQRAAQLASEICWFWSFYPWFCASFIVEHHIIMSYRIFASLIWQEIFRTYQSKSIPWHRKGVICFVIFTVFVLWATKS